MELKDFVTEALCQIAEGIVEAQKKTGKLGATINPPLVQKSEGQSINTGNKVNYVAHFVAFDVSLAVKASGSTGGKAKIFIAMFGGEGTKDHTQSSASQTRISFSVPVSWPPACAPEQDSGELPAVISVRGSRWDSF